MNTRFKPTITGELVTLRPFSRADAEVMLRAVNEPVTRRLTGTHASFTREQIENWCERIATEEGRVDLAITIRSDEDQPDERNASGTNPADDFVGEVVLNDIDTDNLSSGFRISLAAPRYFGKGYGSEAARLMLDYGFHELGLNRIALEVYGFNDRALHVYEKLGFKREGRLREALFMDGEFHDAIVMGLLRREYLGSTD